MRRHSLWGERGAGFPVGACCLHPTERRGRKPRAPPEPRECHLPCDDRLAEGDSWTGDSNAHRRQMFHYLKSQMDFSEPVLLRPKLLSEGPRRMRCDLSPFSVPDRKVSDR